MALLPILFAFASPSFAQTIKHDIEKKAAKSNPTENAAKADVYIHKKNRIIFDKEQMQAATSEKKKKKKRCNKPSK